MRATVDLEHDTIYDVIVDLYESNSTKFDRIMLKQFIEMKIAIRKTNDRGEIGCRHRKVEDTSKITFETVKKWSEIFLDKYN